MSTNPVRHYEYPMLELPGSGQPSGSCMLRRWSNSTSMSMVFGSETMISGINAKKCEEKSLL